MSCRSHILLIRGLIWLLHRTRYGESFLNRSGNLPWLTTISSSIRMEPLLWLPMDQKYKARRARRSTAVLTVYCDS
jgi:hypothetical protein